MWQEIIVALLVVASAFFIGRRFWNNFKGAGTSSSDCGCGCSGCHQSGELPPECKPSGEKAGCK